MEKNLAIDFVGHDLTSLLVELLYWFHVGRFSFGIDLNGAIFRRHRVNRLFRFFVYSKIYGIARSQREGRLRIAHSDKRLLAFLVVSFKRPVLMHLIEVLEDVICLFLTVQIPIGRTILKIFELHRHEILRNFIIFVFFV